MNTYMSVLIGLFAVLIIIRLLAACVKKITPNDLESLIDGIRSNGTKDSSIPHLICEEFKLLMNNRLNDLRAHQMKCTATPIELVALLYGIQVRGLCFTDLGISEEEIRLLWRHCWLNRAHKRYESIQLLPKQLRWILNWTLDYSLSPINMSKEEFIKIA